MSWQLQLATQPLRTLHIIEGEPRQIAVRDIRALIQFYDLTTGAQYPDLKLDLDLLDQDIPEDRRAGFETLIAPNQTYLPYVSFKYSDLYVSDGGKTRLIHDLGAGLTLEIGEDIIPLEMENNPSIKLFHWDRREGIMAALTDEKQLYIFKQNERLHRLECDTLPQKIFITQQRLLLAESNQLKLLDLKGKLLRQQGIHFTLGEMAVSPNGDWILVSDTDHQVLRLYNRDLIPIRQQHLVDLLSRARQLQLFTDDISFFAPVRALDLADDGTLVFAIAGVICQSSILSMSELPQQRVLL